MQDGLLAWMRAIEREKLALNLRHVRVGAGVERALRKVEVRRSLTFCYAFHFSFFL